MLLFQLLLLQKISKTEMQKSNTKLVKVEKNREGILHVCLSLPLGTSWFIVKTFSSAVEHVHISHAWCHIMPPHSCHSDTETLATLLHIRRRVWPVAAVTPQPTPNHPHHNPCNKPSQRKSKRVPELRVNERERERARQCFGARANELKQNKM